MMNQPEQPLAENVPELLQQRAHRIRERGISKLLDFTAHGHRPLANVIEDTEPILMINGREKAVEALRVHQQRTTGDKDILLPADQSLRVAYNRIIRECPYPEANYWIIWQQARGLDYLFWTEVRNIVVQEKYLLPSAHTCKRQTEITLDADVASAVGDGCWVSASIEGEQFKQMLRKMIRKTYHDYTGLIEFSLNPGEFIDGTLRVDRDQQALELHGEICGRQKLVSFSYRRDNNRVDSRADTCYRRSNLARRKTEQLRV